MMAHRRSQLPDDWIESLHRHRYTITDIVALVGGVLLAADHPYSAEELLHEVQAQRAKTGRASVYRALQKFESLGLVRRVHYMDQCNTYVAVSGSDSVLFVCEQCRCTDWLPVDATWREKMRRVLGDGGHRVTNLNLQVSGVCPTCTT